MTRFIIILLVGLVSVLPARSQDRPAPSRHQPTPSQNQATWGGPYRSILDDPAVRAAGERGLDALYDMRADDASVIFDSLAASYPKHPIGSFLQGLSVWWRILPSLMTGETPWDRDFIRLMDQTVDRAEKLDRDGPYALDRSFFKAAALGFRGRLLSNRREWFRAARDGRESLDLVFDLAERDPANPDLQFGRAVYDYFASVIPDEYPIVRPFMAFFPDADKERGLEQLDFVGRHGRFVGTEAVYFLLQIHYLYEPDYAKSLHYANELRRRHPTNAYFHLLLGRVHARWGRWKDARVSLDDFVRRHEAGDPGYGPALAEQAFYFRGRALFGAGDVGSAKADFRRLDRLVQADEATYYQVLGRLRLGMLLDLEGDRAAATRQYRRVLDGPDHGDSRERARTYLKRPFGS